MSGRLRADLRARLAALVVGALAGLGGCAGTEMENSVREVRTIAKEARDNGAYKCAPRELALAETHLEFASTELDQGDYFRAKDHLQIADETVIPEDLNDSLVASLQRVQVDDDDEVDAIGSLSASAEALRLTAAAPPRNTSLGADCE